MFPLRKLNTQDTISAMLPGHHQARCELWPQVFVSDPESFALFVKIRTAQICGIPVDTGQFLDTGEESSTPGVPPQ